jgi:hypothetical protein
MHSLEKLGGDGRLQRGPFREVLEVRLVAILVDHFIEDCLLESTGGIFFDTKFDLKKSQPSRSRIRSSITYSGENQSKGYQRDRAEGLHMKDTTRGFVLEPDVADARDDDLVLRVAGALLGLLPGVCGDVKRCKGVTYVPHNEIPTPREAFCRS